MALSRSELLKELLPGLNAIFGTDYERPIGTVSWKEHDDSYCSDGRVVIISWDGKEWVTISEPMSLEEAEALVKAS